MMSPPLPNPPLWLKCHINIMYVEMVLSPFALAKLCTLPPSHMLKASFPAKSNLLNGSEDTQACVLAQGVRREGILLTVCPCVCVFFTTCSSIHDHTDSHCFMKLLQGQLKETLFEWPEGKSHGDMVQRSQRVLQENKCAYINGEETFILMYLLTNTKNKLAACH